METDLLKAFEKKCIQEEPAYCTAACPFHMDVKDFLGHMAQQAVDKAFKVLEKTLPLPEILARICDHPCENKCIRKKTDAPVGIGSLERVCAAARSTQKKRFLPPPNGKKVGIWGSGLSSLTVAWDLVLKGYNVVVYDQDQTRGGHLLKLSRTVLPEKILCRELDTLQSRGVRFTTADSPDDVFGAGKKQSFDAVYIGFDSPGDRYSGMSYDDDGVPIADKFSLRTADPIVFAGGFSATGSLLNRDTYPVAHAAQGRKAATSIDRVVSNVSITAGREKEGACETRLSTDMSRIEPRPAIDVIVEPDPATGVDLQKAGQEAQRCIQCDCSRCIRVCPYIEAFKGFPGKYAREIFNNVAIVMGERKSNLLINSCSLCDLCETVCPNDFSMADLCLTARREMVEAGKMPVSAHEFALEEMGWASGEDCFFARHAPGRDHSDRIFFPGCQLLGSSPSQVKNVYEFLTRNLPGSTGFATGCCGAPARWAGREPLFKKNLDPFKTFWDASGRPPVITACTSCTRMLEHGLAGADISSLFQQMAELPGLLPDAAIDLKDRLSDRINIIDPCTARNDSKVQEAVRALAGFSGLQISELPASGSLTECCGFGGLVYNANFTLSRDIIRQRADQSDHDFLAYCAMCRDRLASTGKKAVHILDLFWPDTDPPELRKDPGFSRRHDNLSLAKNRMLADVWHEQGTGKTGANSIQTHISPRVEKILEDQYILTSDIQKVLAHFEAGAGCFIHPDNKSMIAFFRPNSVCFWVEFKKDGTHYKILNAWRHRMDLVAGNGFVPGAPDQDHDPAVLCGKCNQALDPCKNHVEYLGSRFDVTLPQCAECGIVFIPRKMALGKMAEVEKILEDK